MSIGKEHIPILVDDIISTGRTMIETITHLKNAGMKPLFALCTRSIC
jgi:ribose-phosphate pyrophosphokinase